MPGSIPLSITYDYSHHHESLENLMAADVYFGRKQTILLEQERIKRATNQNRRAMSRVLH